LKVIRKVSYDVVIEIGKCELSLIIGNALRLVYIKCRRVDLLLGRLQQPYVRELLRPPAGLKPLSLLFGFLVLAVISICIDVLSCLRCNRDNNMLDDVL
jgi:hypothetical protein